MALRKIIKYGDPVLTTSAERVQTIDQDILDLVRDMIETMHSAPGVGLAAPQVRVSKRVITVDISVGENEADLIVLVNPEILGQEGEVILEEGCLSVPDVQERVARPARVVVRGLDLEGKEKVYQARDHLARVFCHEIDHLNGRLFIERLSPLKRALVKKKLKKLSETGTA